MNFDIMIEPVEERVLEQLKKSPTYKNMSKEKERAIRDAARLAFIFAIGDVQNQKEKLEHNFFFELGQKGLDRE